MDTSKTRPIHDRMRSIVLPIIIVLVLCGGFASEAATGTYSVWLRANPQAIVADSYSSTTVTAEVRDSSGRAAPDGTTIELTTSLGVVDRTARTTAGVARATLRGDTTIGTAVVSAVVLAGNAVAQLRVDFLEPGTEMFDESFISVFSQKHLGYDVGGQRVDSAGGVTIEHRGLKIEAEEAQIDCKRNVLRAKGRTGGENISIARGDKQLAASALYYDFNLMKGVILTPAEDGAKRILFRGRDLFTQIDEKPDKLATFDFEPVSRCTMFIKARSILIRPGEEIKIKRANFYLEGDKVLSVPLHVVPLGSRGGGMNQMLAYGTDGLRLDLPLYYSLTPNSTGAVRLKHSEPTGWGYYSGRTGWQLDVDQEYTSSASTEGVVSISRITSGDWGLRWNQRRELENNSRLFTYIDYPSHRDLYGTVDYSRSLGDYTMNLGFRGNKLRNLDDRYYTIANFQSRSKPLIGNSVNYALSTRFSYDSNLGEGHDKLGRGIGLQLYGKPLRFGANSNLSTSISLSRDWGGGYAGASAYANAGYYSALGRIGQFGLNYSYQWSGSGLGYSSHRLAADLALQPSNRWSARVYATLGLGDSTASSFGELSYSPLPGWRFSFLGTFQKFGSYNYTDSEYAFSKSVGKQEAKLIWSQLRKRFRLEFSALSF